MAGAKRRHDVGVVLAALILVADEQRDRRAGGAALEHAGENLHGIRLAPLRDVARGARLAAVEFGLDVGLADLQAGRAAIDHATDGGAMGFAERGDAKQTA